MGKESIFVPLEVTEIFASKVGKKFNIFVFEMGMISYKR
jgi:hypothetical protein